MGSFGCSKETRGNSCVSKQDACVAVWCLLFVTLVLLPVETRGVKDTTAAKAEGPR